MHINALLMNQNIAEIVQFQMEHFEFSHTVLYPLFSIVMFVSCYVYFPSNKSTAF